MFNNPIDKTMTVDEACSYLVVPDVTLRRWIKEGRIASNKAVRPETLNRAEVEALKVRLEQQTLKKRIITNKRLDGRDFKMVRVTNANTVPDGFDLIATYKGLREYTLAFAAGKIPFMLLIGSAGGGKSQQMKADLGVGTANQKCTWIEGHVRPIALYCSVYEAKGRPIVLDDVVHFFDNKDAQSIVKCLCQTNKTRQVCWESSTKVLDDRAVPRCYETQSHICFIGNKWEESNVDMLAIRDRAAGGRVAFYPSPEEIHNRVLEQGWCRDKEILSFVAQHMHKIPQMSMRTYHDALVWQESGMDWRKKCLAVWGLEPQVE